MTAKVIKKRVHDDVTLAQQMKLHNRNQKIADKIIREMDKRGCHIRIGVSSSGLRLLPMDARSSAELGKLLRQKPTLRLSIKGKV